VVRRKLTSVLYGSKANPEFPEFRMRTIDLFLAATALVGVTPALAQTAPAPSPSSGPPAPAAAAANPDDLVIVTGSRLQRPISDTVEPTFIINAAQIETRGYTNVGDVLRELPLFGAGVNGVGSGQSGFGPGQVFADLFSLGAQRTLTLIDGIRVVPNNTTSTFGPGNSNGSGASGSEVDLNTIPVNLIERVDTVAVGGAPIYGSDAIAGTVNIILKQHFDGLQLEGENSISDHGDAANYRLSALAGHNFAGGRGNVVASFEYNHQDPLVYNDRASTAAGLFFGAAPAGSPYKQVLYPAQRLPGLSEQGIPFVMDGYPFSPADSASLGVVNAAGQPLRFSPGGNLVPIDSGAPTPDGINSSGGNGLNLASVSNLQTSSDRYLGSMLAHYAVSDHLKLFVDALFSESDTTNAIAQGYYNTALFAPAGQINGNFIIPISNPFLTAQARSLIQSSLPAGQNVFYLSRANEDIEPSLATGDQTTYRILAGANGNFGFGSHNIQYHLTGSYGFSKQVNRSPQIVNQNFNNAVNATTDASGNIICAPGYTNAPIATLSSTCAPLNLFGYGSPSLAALNYITANARSESQNELVDVVATVGDNSLFKLPGGGVGFLIGYEHRDERGRFDPGTFYLGQPNGDGTYTQYGNSIPVPPVNGGFYTNEGFAEITLPIVSRDNGLRFLNTLEVKAAARYVQHSVSGGDWTWTGGGRLAIVRDVTFTGNFTRAIRSPAITELYAPVGQNFVTALDPCDSRNITSGPNPANRAKNCAAAGITQPFVSNIDAFTIPGSSGGNPNLKNEISNSWTVGALINPRFAHRLFLNVNWVNIDLTNAITALSATNILDACYDATSYPTTICSNITRSGTGQVTFLKSGNENAAESKFAGLTAGINWQIPTPFIGATGKVTLSGNYLYTDTQQFRVGTGDAQINVGSIGYNRHSATANFNYDSDLIGFQLQARYLGAAVFNANDAPKTRDIPGVPDVVFLNASLTFNIDKRFSFRVNCDNILSQGSPYPAVAQDTSTYFAGILGRYYRAAFLAKF